MVGTFKSCDITKHRLTTLNSQMVYIQEDHNTLSILCLDKQRHCTLLKAEHASNPTDIQVVYTAVHLPLSHHENMKTKPPIMVSCPFEMQHIPRSHMCLLTTPTLVQIRTPPSRSITTLTLLPPGFLGRVWDVKLLCKTYVHVGSDYWQFIYTRLWGLILLCVKIKLFLLCFRKTLLVF